MSQETERVKLARKLISQYQAVFTSPEGKAVLKDLISVNFVLDSTFAGGDTNLAHLREGQRNVVLRILTILKIDPAKFLEQSNERESSHV
jgi:hypothetical protein